MKLAVSGSLGLLFAVTACGGAAVPQDNLTSSQAAIRAAEVGGAPEDPQAALLVKKSKDGVAEAKKKIEDGDNHEAKLLLMMAESDAELALALAQELTMKREAEAARKQVEDLRQRQGK